MKVLTILIFFSIYTNTIYSQKTNLPAWLLNPDYYNNSEYAIGVSDPLPDSTVAFEQAFYRALINYALLHKAKYAALSTVANANTQQNNFNASSIETILFSSLLKANFFLNDSFVVVHKNYSDYDECFVLLKKNNEHKRYKNRLKFSLIRRVAFYTDDAEMPVLSDEIEISAFMNEQEILNYKINRDILSKYSILSKFWHHNQWIKLSVENKYRNYAYANFDQSKFYQCSENLSYGFWAAYLYALSDQITIYSALNQGFTQSLVSIREGNIQGQMIASELEVFYNTKKVEILDINIHLEKLELYGNNLIVSIDKNKAVQNIDYLQLVLQRKERKMLKKKQKEAWQEINTGNYLQAYYIQKYYQNKDNYINSEATIKSGNIAIGLIQGILTARLGLETQAKSKIVSLAKTESNNEKNTLVKNSKLLRKTNSIDIFPYLFFIKKITENTYLIHTKLFYEIKK